MSDASTGQSPPERWNPPSYGGHGLEGAQSREGRRCGGDGK